MSVDALVHCWYFSAFRWLEWFYIHKWALDYLFIRFFFWWSYSLVIFTWFVYLLWFKSRGSAKEADLDLQFIKLFFKTRRKTIPSSNYVVNHWQYHCRIFFFNILSNRVTWSQTYNWRFFFPRNKFSSVISLQNTQCTFFFGWYAQLTFRISRAFFAMNDGKILCYKMTHTVTL